MRSLALAEFAIVEVVLRYKRVNLKLEAKSRKAYFFWAMYSKVTQNEY